MTPSSNKIEGKIFNLISEYGCKDCSYATEEEQMFLTKKIVALITTEKHISFSEGVSDGLDVATKEQSTDKPTAGGEGMSGNDGSKNPANINSPLSLKGMTSYQIKPLEEKCTKCHGTKQLDSVHGPQPCDCVLEKAFKKQKCGCPPHGHFTSCYIKKLSEPPEQPEWAEWHLGFNKIINNPTWTTDQLKSFIAQVREEAVKEAKKEVIKEIERLLYEPMEEPNDVSMDKSAWEKLKSLTKEV